jgi:deoxycytidine triphosphate deaminase
MARCTAPVEGHRSASAAANCPACRGGRFGRYSGYSSYGYSSRSYSSPSYYSPPYSSSGSSAGGSSRSTKPRWSRPGSSQLYTLEEVRALTPIRDSVEKRASLPDLRHIFLCHAWDDRQGVAKELYDLLVARDVSVWFSENDIGLGEPFLRAIDKGLAKSRIGIVLVTPALLKTYERMWVPRNMIARVEGRSTYARVGLSMHETAPWLQPGWDGQITLEIRNSGPFRIELMPMDDRPCQVTFFMLTSELPEDEAYGSRPTDAFQHQSSTLPKTT